MADVRDAGRQVMGDVAHDVADNSLSYPVKIGGQASTSVPTAVASGDRVNAYFDVNGRQVIRADYQVVSTFDHGRKSAIGTTAVQITTTSIAANLGVIVKAANGNTARIFVGNSDVTADSADATDGFELDAGESILVPINNANLVYVRAESGSQKAFFLVA